MKEVLKFLKDSEVYYIATNDNGTPRVRPFGTINLFEDKLYIQTSKVKSFSKQVSLNNKVEICALLQDRWIRIEANLIEDNRIEPKEKMLEAYPNLRSLYKASDSNNQVFYLKDATATIYGFSKIEKVIKF
ncbi:MAG: pyridoxamine 5'-phosphate oxidase family protein [Acholeplasmatales bacterium]|jgi:uncharacterized pyridoxamine 5'-phosphate oxidase family protein|nr:pyridoxamine 5'-phosphate oxidase family protein [Acholeplasmatales bacterium]